MRKTLAICRRMTWLVMGFIAFASLASPVFIVPTLTTTIGQTVTLPIYVLGAADLESFQFDLLFSPGIANADPAGVTAGSLLPFDWFFTGTGAVDNGAGLVLGTSAYGSGVDGDGILANIQFTAIADGSTTISLANAFAGFGVPALVTGEIIVGEAVATVAEPSSAALALLAIFALGVTGGSRWKSFRKCRRCADSE